MSTLNQKGKKDLERRQAQQAFRRWKPGRRMTLRARLGAPYVMHDCQTCTIEGFRPSHWGSIRCESGSLASGGKNAHCTCNTCF